MGLVGFCGLLGLRILILESEHQIIRREWIPFERIQNRVFIQKDWFLWNMSDGGNHLIAIGVFRDLRDFYKIPEAFEFRKSLIT